MADIVCSSCKEQLSHCHWHMRQHKQCLVANAAMVSFVRRRRRDRWTAKYELVHTVRTHMGASDANFGCVVQREDANGKVRSLSQPLLMTLALSW